MTWLLCSLAAADPGQIDSFRERDDTGGCFGDSLLFVAPSSQDRAVPPDLVPTLFLSDCSGTATGHTAQLLRDGSSVLAATGVEGTDGVFSYAEIPVSLQPDSDYELVVTQQFGEETAIGFSTGSEDHTPLTAGPTWVETLWDDDGSVRIQVEGTSSPHGVTFLEAREGDAVRATGILDGTRATMRPETSPAGEQCLTLFQRDVDGTWIQGGDFCHTNPGGCGCGSGRAPAGLAPLMLAGLLVRRRR